MLALGLLELDDNPWAYFLQDRCLRREVNDGSQAFQGLYGQQDRRVRRVQHVDVHLACTRSRSHLKSRP